ncbi:hypothetical protein MTBLM1_20354 [Rhodospirillaceae bacterium LM-1]|nr:hypothetical protein MTBLM1_20354 [Rhodospirillaceae bacterium LM-1]
MSRKGVNEDEVPDVMTSECILLTTDADAPWGV